MSRYKKCRLQAPELASCQATILTFMQVGLSETAREKYLRLQSYGNACKEGMLIDDTCTICQHCFADNDEVYVLPCKHCFHGNCVAPWFKVSKVREYLAAVAGNVNSLFIDVFCTG